MGEEAFPQRLGLRLRSLGAELRQPLLDRPCTPALAIEFLEEGDEGGVVGHGGGPLGDFYEDVKVVAHHAISDHPHPAKAFVEPHKLDKLLLFWRPEDKLPVHNAGDAVVIGEWMFGRGFETGATHRMR